MSARGRGRPRTIDRERIVAAARRLDPEELTMQAVADELGVNRQSLSYHVADRDELLRLVAVEEVAARTRSSSALAEDWPEAVRRYATSLRDAVAEVGVLSWHVRPSGADHLGFLAPAEAVIASLFEAGLDEHLAVAAVNAIIDIGLAAGRASAAPDSDERQAQADAVEKQLLGDPSTPLPALRRAAAAHALLDADAQFRFDIELCIRGLASLIAERTAV